MSGNSVRNYYEDYHIRPQTHFLGRVMQRKRRNVLRHFLRSVTEGNILKQKILIVGCGSGEDLSITDQQVYALDLSLNAVRISESINPENYYVCGDATALPFQSEKFDVLICSEVIEHIPKAKEAVLELYRVLKPGGKLLLTTPNWLSFYGLTRKFAEAVTHRSVTSAGQPIDHWYTYRSLAQLLSPEFSVTYRRGVWYFPPTGRGMKVIPAIITYPNYLIFRPFEELLSRVLSGLGHILAVICNKV